MQGQKQYTANVITHVRLSERVPKHNLYRRLDILLFLGYEVDAGLPWHSTVSRTRQLYSPGLFEHLCERVFVLCVALGLVAGDPALALQPRFVAQPLLKCLCVCPGGFASRPLAAA